MTRCTFGLHRWVETYRRWNGLFYEAMYRCSECGTPRERWERRGDMSLDPNIRKAQQDERQAEAAELRKGKR